MKLKIPRECSHCDRVSTIMYRCPMGQPGHQTHFVCDVCHAVMTADAPPEPKRAP